MCSINFTQLSDDTMWSVVPSFDSDKHPETGFGSCRLAHTEDVLNQLMLEVQASSPQRGTCRWKSRLAHPEDVLNVKVQTSSHQRCTCC